MGYIIGDGGTIGALVEGIGSSGDHTPYGGLRPTTELAYSLTHNVSTSEPSPPSASQPTHTNTTPRRVNHTPHGGPRFTQDLAYILTQRTDAGTSG